MLKFIRENHKENGSVFITKLRCEFFNQGYWVNEIVIIQRIQIDNFPDVRNRLFY